MATAHPLDPYRAKRDFGATPEPAGAAGGVIAAPGEALSFVIQKHAARNLHYDFRLELDGTLKSWAVPKGPSLDATVKRMAVQVEDHPLDYAAFEGTIPEGHYGAGTVIVWDRGTWRPLGDARAGLRDGRLKFELHGQKLAGRWALVRMKPRAGERQPAWLLMKEKDDHARPAAEHDVVAALPHSVLSPPAGAAQHPPSAAAVAPAAKKAPAGRGTAAKRVATGAGKTATALSTDIAAPPTAKAAVRPRPAAAGSPPRHDRDAAPAITHPERVVDAASGVTKGRLAAYYAEAAESMLPHLRGRALSLLRAPAGVGQKTFFQRHAEGRALPGAESLDPSLDPGHAPLLSIGSREALLGAVQMNVIEFHTWNSTTRDFAHPDRMVFDLDPGDGVEFAQVRGCAVLLRAFLGELGLAAWLKTSGGKGLHVVVPHAPGLGWEAAKDFSRAIVEHVAGVLPKQFVARSGAAHRVGRIYIDYLRNGFGATTACAWSVRARAGLGVSVPVDWSELDALTGGAHWGVDSVGERLAAVGNAPWQGYAKKRQTLARAMKTLGFDSAAAG